MPIFRGGLDGNPTIKNQNITTLVSGIKQRADRLKWNLVYEKGSELKTADGSLLSRATQAAGAADFIVVALGEPAYSEMFEPIDDLYVFCCILLFRILPVQFLMLRDCTEHCMHHSCSWFASFVQLSIRGTRIVTWMIGFV